MDWNLELNKEMLIYSKHFLEFASPTQFVFTTQFN